MDLEEKSSNQCKGCKQTFKRLIAHLTQKKTCQEAYEDFESFKESFRKESIKRKNATYAVKKSSAKPI